jgi:hypothetical protein
MVGVRECIGTRAFGIGICREVEIESETSETVLVTEVGCYSTRTRRSIVESESSSSE